MNSLLVQVDTNTVMILGIALLNAFTAVVTYRTSRSVKATDDNIHSIKIATDGMKDALVKVTGEAEYAKGLKKGEEKSNAERP